MWAYIYRGGVAVIVMRKVGQILSECKQINNRLLKVIGSTAWVCKTDNNRMLNTPTEEGKEKGVDPIIRTRRRT